MMKAIETRWKGYRFRSRLEARWAVFFEEVGLRWEYEAEGYDLGDGRFYLPDFVMRHNPGRGPIVEIKPTEPTHDEASKLLDVCASAREGAGAYGALIWGAPGSEQWRGIHKDGCFSGDEDHDELIVFLGLYGLPTKEARRRHAAGVLAARSARFEHGEVPA